MVLYVYIGTVLISFGIFELFILAVRQEIKNYGYVWVRRKKNSFRKVIFKFKKFLVTVFAVCIPIFNLILALTILFNYDEVMKKSIEGLIRKGTIEKANEVKIK